MLEPRKGYKQEGRGMYPSLPTGVDTNGEMVYEEEMERCQSEHAGFTQTNKGEMQGEIE